jgi:hypothetical protein
MARRSGVGKSASVIRTDETYKAVVKTDLRPQRLVGGCRLETVMECEGIARLPKRIFGKPL